MDELRVRTADIGTLAANLGKAADESKQQQDQLDQELVEMCKKWSGESADAFLTSYQQTSKDLEKREATLRAAQALAEALEDTYARTDMELAKLFGE